MSPSSPRGRFWRRFVRVAVLLWLALFIPGLLSMVGVIWSSEGSGGLAAVSVGVSEALVETAVVLIVSLSIAWVWGRFANRRS